MTSLSTVISTQEKKGLEMQMTVLGLDLSCSLSLGCSHGWLPWFVVFHPVCLPAPYITKSAQMNFPDAHIKQITWPHIQPSSPVSFFIYCINVVVPIIFTAKKIVIILIILFHYIFSQIWWQYKLHIFFWLHVESSQWFQHILYSPGVKHYINSVAADALLKALVIMWNKGPRAGFTEQWKVVTVM